MRLILTEKPSVAQDVARAFRNVERKEGYIKAWDRKLGEFVIVWCYGHLFEIDTKKIAPSGIVLPERFEYKPRSRKHERQFRLIKKLLKDAEEVYIFTDPEREGELIARLVLIHAGWKKWDRTYRMWTSKALTPDVVKEEIEAKRPAKNFDPVFKEALARQHAGWTVGIPLSRVLMRSSDSSLSVGRVQTPTLALLVQREEQIRNFKPQPYIFIKGVFQNGEESFEAVFWKKKGSRGAGGNSASCDYEEDKEEDKEEGGKLSPQEGKRILEDLKSLKEGKVERIERKRKKEPPPLLHSLTTLQQEASEIYGFSAQKTLDLAQSLYEKKLISYPRTESRHLSEKDRGLVREVLLRLGKKELLPNVDKVGKRVFDDSKLTDHFAIIPLAPPSGNLSEEEIRIYDLVWRRFVGAFMDDFRYEETVLRIRVGKYLFRAKGKRVIKLGWRELWGDVKETFLPRLLRGQVLRLVEVKSERKLTQPPPRYTEGSLVGKMKSLGLGTPATRSEIIRSLFERGYIKRAKGRLTATEKGELLVRELSKRSSPLVSPEMTAEWERKLREIREGKKTYEEFMEEIREFVREQIRVLEGIRVEGDGKGRRSGRWSLKRKYGEGRQRSWKRG